MKRAAPTVALMVITAMLGGALVFAVAAAFAEDAPATVMVSIRMLTTRLAECQEKGGCAFLTRAEIAEMYMKGQMDGREAAFESLDFHGCRADRS